jgi:hypothetical protein
VISDKRLNEIINENIIYGCPNCQKLHKERKELAQEILQLRSTMVQAARGSAGIVDLAEENIELQAQVTTLKTKLFGMTDAARTCAHLYRQDINKISKIISSDAGKDYHNPADVEALKKAKEAMEYLYLGIPFNTKESLEKTENALAAIAKVLGGKEDV